MNQDTSRRSLLDSCVSFVYLKESRDHDDGDAVMSAAAVSEAVPGGATLMSCRPVAGEREAAIGARVAACHARLLMLIDGSRSIPVFFPQSPLDSRSEAQSF